MLGKNQMGTVHLKITGEKINSFVYQLNRERQHMVTVFLLLVLSYLYF